MRIFLRKIRITVAASVYTNPENALVHAIIPSKTSARPKGWWSSLVKKQEPDQEERTAGSPRTPRELARSFGRTACAATSPRKISSVLLRLELPPELLLPL
jgi:hypothetical protein